MVLKVQRVGEVPTDARGLNRTVVVLKGALDRVAELVDARLNRTVVVLKVDLRNVGSRHEPQFESNL